jgi:transcriptional regulator with XRE-family HTH domain
MNDTSTIYLALGKRLKESRKKAGLTQEQLAKQLNLTRTTVTNIESGRQSVTIHLMYEISEALSVSISELLVRLNTSVISHKHNIEHEVSRTSAMLGANNQNQIMDLARTRL